LDGRRIYGSVYGISPTQQNGHIYLSPAVWLTSDGDGSEQVIEMLLSSNTGYLFSADSISFVECVDPVKT